MRAACVVLALLGAARADEPIRPGAKAHLDAAFKHYARHAFDQAVTEFHAAYDLDPRREILFGWAQAERLSGHCASAAGLYRRFLAGVLSPAEERAARLNLEKCEELLKAARPAPPPPPLVTPQLIAPPIAPWERDRSGLALAVLGGTTLVLGVALAGASAGVESDATHAASYAAYDDGLGSAQALRSGGIACVAVGGALAIAAAVRFAVVARRAHRPVAGVVRTAGSIGRGAAF